MSLDKQTLSELTMKEMTLAEAEAVRDQLCLPVYATAEQWYYAACDITDPEYGELAESFSAYMPKVIEAYAILNKNIGEN
jgi:hypothetical protein